MNNNRSIADYFQIKKKENNPISASVGKLSNNQPFNSTLNQITDATNNYSNLSNNNTMQNKANNPFTSNNPSNPFITKTNTMDNNPIKPVMGGNSMINPFNTSGNVNLNNNNNFPGKQINNNTYSVINNNQNSHLNSGNNLMNANIPINNNNAFNNGFNNNGANIYNNNNSNNLNNNNEFNSYLNANVNTNQNNKINSFPSAQLVNNPINPFNTNINLTSNQNNNPFTINRDNANIALNNTNNNINQISTNGYNTPPVNSNPFGANYNNNNNNLNNNNNPSNLNSNPNINGNLINQMQTNKPNPFNNINNNFTNANQTNSISNFNNNINNNNNAQNYLNLNNNNNNLSLMSQNNLNSNLTQFSFNKNNSLNLTSSVLNGVPTNFNMQKQINPVDLKAIFNDFPKEDKEAYESLNNFISRNGSVYSRINNKQSIEEFNKENKKTTTTLMHMAANYWKSCDPMLIRYIDYQSKQGKPVNKKNLFLERKFQANKLALSNNIVNNSNSNIGGFVGNTNNNFNNFNNNNLNGNMNNGLNQNNYFNNLNNNNNQHNNFNGTTFNNNTNINGNFNTNHIQNNLNAGLNTNNGNINNPNSNGINNFNSNLVDNNKNFSFSGNTNINNNQGFNNIPSNNSNLTFSNNFNTNSANNNINNNYNNNPILPLNNNGFNSSLLRNQNSNMIPINNPNALGHNNLNNPMLNNDFNNNKSLNQNMQNNINNNFFNNLIPINQNTLNNNNAAKDYDFFGTDNSNINQKNQFNQGFNVNSNTNPNNIGFLNASDYGNNLNNNGFQNNVINNNNLNNNPFQAINNNNNFLNSNALNSNLQNNQIPFNSNLYASNLRNNNYGFNANQQFNSGFNPNLNSNLNNFNANLNLSHSNLINNQAFLNEEAYKQYLLGLKLKELRRQPYGSLGSDVDINKFLDNFGNKEDEGKLAEKIKFIEHQRIEDQEKIKKDLYAKIDKILEEDAYSDLFPKNKKGRFESDSTFNLNTIPVETFNKNFKNVNEFKIFNLPKKSIFDNDRNFDYNIKRENGYRSNKSFDNNNTNTTIINNNYNSYFNLSSNPFLYKNANSFLEQQNKTNFKHLNSNTLNPYLNNTNNYQSKFHTSNINKFNNKPNQFINYNNISRRNFNENQFLEKVNFNKDTSNKSFNINEFTNSFRKTQQINLNSEINNNLEDLDFTNSMEYLKLTNEFLNLEEKKNKHKTNKKYNASYYKNPFIMQKGYSNTSNSNNFLEWKNNLNEGRKFDSENQAKNFNFNNKKNMEIITEEKDDASVMISYEDIYIKKSENENCELKNLKFSLKDPTLNQIAKFQISVNLNITGLELKKIIFDYLQKENPMFEGLDLTHENILINTNVGSITDDKQLKSNSYINENIELLVLISESSKDENQFEIKNIRIQNKIFDHRNIEDTFYNNNNNNNKKDNLDLSSINSKGETYSNIEYSETKNLIRDVWRSENAINNNYNNYKNEQKDANVNLPENKGNELGSNQVKIENDLFDDYLVRKQLYKDAKRYFPKTMKFQTIPSLVELKNYSYPDLRKVENFTVFNEHGKITFKGFTDISFLDLDKIITIDPMVVMVYEENDFPEVNQELNKAAVIEIYNYQIINNDEENSNFSISCDIIEDHKQKVEQSIKDKEGNLIEFNLEKKLLKFEVQYMIKKNE